MNMCLGLRFVIGMENSPDALIAGLRIGSRASRNVEGSEVRCEYYMNSKSKM